MSLNKLRDQALSTAVSHGFTDSTPGEDIALVHSELSEALEDIRGGCNLDEVFYTRKIQLSGFKDENGNPLYVERRMTGPVEADGTLNKPCGVPSEMADVLIRVFHFCGKHNIDIDKIVAEKMAYNESRPFKHGGKKL